MKQIEIRLAVVLYGGVSLAVYIHGVTRELLNLIRASQRFHVDRDRARNGNSPEFSAASGDSTAIYRDLLEQLSPHIDLRIVIDLISGASAGGINGVMMARALAHDLPLESHRDLWLGNADVTQLSAPASLASRILKAPLAPLIDKLLMRRFGPQVADAETRAKIRRFVQARWFKPPFAGDRFAGWMLDACDRMDSGMEKGGCLLPPGHRLDLFVTLTDYRGHRQRIELHDPPVVEETEHRRILAFTCRRHLSGEIESEFGPDHVPGLVFASRATSSFPGAFSPATIAEMDEVLDQRDRYWPTRNAFITGKLGVTDNIADAARNRFYIDGSVVMNKPFSPVIRSLGDRPAAREIVRRIIYVDPNPRPDAPQRTGSGTPGFFRTILASLAVIPRNEPIAEDLGTIESWNRHARRLAEILNAADPEVERLVDDIVDLDPNNPPTIADVTRYRKLANEAAHRGAGYAYLSYQKLKLRSVIEHFATFLARLVGHEADNVTVFRIGAVVDRWLAEGTPADPDAPPEDAALDPVIRRRIRFLRAFDVAFRTRRVRFVIRRLNELYRDLAVSADGERLDSGRIDALKSALYEAVDEASMVWRVERYGTATVAAARRLFDAAMADGEIETADMRVIERSLGLLEIDARLDEVISVVGFAFLPPPTRRAVAKAYVGFAFFDLITFPILQWTEMDEINEVLVDRISPDDATGLHAGGVTLRGTSLMSFGAFFNRAWREHDFLWGRLNAAERCVDVILSAVGPHMQAPFDPDQLRGRLFLAILDSEEPHLKADPELVPRLRKEVMSRYGFG